MEQKDREEIRETLVDPQNLTPKTPIIPGIPQNYGYWEALFWQAPNSLNSH